MATAKKLNTENERPLGLSDNEEYDFLLDKIQKLSEEPLERVITRLKKKHGYSDEEAREARTAFLQFISLTFITDEPVAPTEVIDDFWHAFILHTKDYEQFCQKHFGDFIHHEPSEGSNTTDEEMAESAANTRELISQLYPDHNRKIWHTSENASCSCNSPCSSCSNCGTGCRNS